MIASLPGMFGAAGGGFSGSSSATSGARTGDVGFGGFNFQPKGGNLPPVAWVALAAALALVGIVHLTRRK